MSSLSVKLMTASFAVLASVLVATPALAQEKLRIALDTNPVHVRNKGVEIFVEELKKTHG